MTVAVAVPAVAAAAAAILLVLVPPLRILLAEVCGAEERGDVWTALSAVALVFGTALAALLGGAFPDNPVVGRDLDGAGAAIRAIRGGLAGLLVSALVIGVLVVVTSQRPRGQSPPVRPHDLPGAA